LIDHFNSNIERMLQDIIQSAQAYQEAWHFMRRHQLGRLVGFSFVYSFIVMVLSAWLIWKGMSFVVDWIFTFDWIAAVKSLFEQYKWLYTLTKWILYIISFVLFLSYFKYIYLALASPLFAYISEVTAEKILNKHYPFILSQF
jgi:hypothetical protein